MNNDCYCGKCPNKKHVPQQQYNLFNVIIQNKKYDCLKEALKSDKYYRWYFPMQMILDNNDLTAFTILYETQKKSIDKYNISSVIHANKLNFLEYLEKQGFKWTKAHVQTAANSNLLTSLKFICEHGGEYDEEVCYNASNLKYWKSVEYLRSLLDK